MIVPEKRGGIEWQVNRSTLIMPGMGDRRHPLRLEAAVVSIAPDAQIGSSRSRLICEYGVGKNLTEAPFAKFCH
jgi:hypothetical protein